MDTDTVCIVTRTHIGELPYIKAFIDYYKRIGINKIYLVITKEHEISVIKDYLIMYEPFVQFVPVQLKDEQSISMDNMNHLLEQITETYTLHIDNDEFLEIAPYTNILTLIKTINADKIHFPWAITVNDGMNDMTKGCRGMTHRKKPFKTICRTDQIANFTSNGHDFDTKTEINGEIHSKFPLIHYWGRTFNDILLKAIYANGFKNCKDSSLDEIVSCLNNPDPKALPVRFKMLAFLSRLDKSIDLSNNYILDYIEYSKEAELIYPIFSHIQRDALYVKYVNYRNNLDYIKIKDMYYKTGLQGTIKWNEI
jgi:hypothetical protein